MDQFYKTKLCPFLILQKCNKGDNCTYAHSESELNPQKNLQKTKLCIAWKKGDCKNENCYYAHGYDELRATEGYFKTTICALWLKGNCHLGENCRHAHGREELHERTYKKTEKQKRVQRSKKTQNMKNSKKGKNENQNEQEENVELEVEKEDDDCNTNNGGEKTKEKRRKTKRKKCNKNNNEESRDNKNKHKKKEDKYLKQKEEKKENNEGKENEISQLNKIMTVKEEKENSNAVNVLKEKINMLLFNEDRNNLIVSLQKLPEDIWFLEEADENQKKKKINNDNANTVIEEIKHQNNSNSTNNEIMNSNISSCEEIHFNFSSLSSSSSIPPIRVTSSISLASVTTDCTLFSELDFSSQDSLHTFSSMEDDDEKEKDNEKTSDKMKEEIIHMQKNEIINDHPRISYSNVSSIHNSSLQIKDSNYETKNGNLFFESISEYNKSNDATDFFSINSQSNFLYNSLPNLNTFSSSTSNYTSCVSYNSFSSSSFAHSSHAESSYPSFVSCSRNQIYSDTLSNYHCITNTSNSFYNCSNDVTNSVSNNNYNKSSTNMYCPSFPSLISSPPFNLNFYSSLQSSPMPTFYPFLIQSIPITTEMLQAACNVQYED